MRVSPPLSVRRGTGGASRAALRNLTAMPALLLAALLLAGCGASDEPPATASETPAAATSSASLASLKDFDFTSTDFVGPLIDRAGGGEVHAERVHFEDLTADGREEAVVIVESGGTAGDVGVAVYALVEGAPAELFFSRLAGRVEVRLGFVVILEGVYENDDPRCCPSRLRELAYGWDGAAFTLASEQVVDNPQR